MDRLTEPFINIRAPHYGEMRQCCAFVLAEWSSEAADRCREQWIAFWQGGKYAPVFLVATNDRDEVIGFVAYQRTMQLTADIIWLVVGKDQQARGVGKALLAAALNVIEDVMDLSVTEVITQKIHFYQRYGFFQVHHLGSGYYLMLRLTSTRFGL